MELNATEEANSSNRLKALSTFTTDPKVVQELMQYTDNQFLDFTNQQDDTSAIREELHVAAWEGYAKAAQSKGVLQVLKKPFVQLNFPIQEGMSQNPNYRKALFKGSPVSGMPEAQGITLMAPDQLEITFMDGPVGKLPALIVHHPQDFEPLMQSFFYKNEPKDIPLAMGASIIKGINNWDRLHQVIGDFRSRYIYRSNQSVFAEINRNKSLYQDTFILISKKPYSNVWPPNFGVANWKEASVKLRMWHEYTHYFTSRHFGTMQNNMHDELLADYLGIHAIKPAFDAQLFLLFVGLEDYPRYRNGGRLENYLGWPKLSPEATKVLQTMVVQAARHVESFDQQIGVRPTLNDLFRRLVAMASLHLEEIAAPGGGEKLIEVYRSVEDIK